MSEPITIAVTVTFQAGTTPNGFVYSPDSVEGISFSGAKATLAGTEQGKNFAFVFELASPGEGQTLAWATPAIVWSNGVVPLPLPSGVTLPSLSENQVAFGFHYDNTSGHPQPFGFRLVVISGGQVVESHDPEIILDPPTP